MLMEKERATHSSTVAWRIPWAEEPGRLQSKGLRRVGHDWATSLSFSLSWIGEGNSNPLQYSCLENPRDRGAWWAAVYGVAQRQTRLKQLSSSSSSRSRDVEHFFMCFLYVYKYLYIFFGEMTIKSFAHLNVRYFFPVEL